MVDPARWEAAQQYEAEYWRGREYQIATDSGPGLGFYNWRAQGLQARLEASGFGHLTDGSADVVEVGSGPVGLVTFFPGRFRAAVDPLADTYGENEKSVESRSPDVEYRQAQGESLPFEDARFDLAVIENCIDHVQDRSAVMAELRRVLRPGGVLHLTVNCRSRPGYWVHRFLSRASLDPGHTYTFTARRGRRFLERSGFEVIDVEPQSDLWSNWKSDLLEKGKRGRLKALLLVSEYPVAYLGIKR